MNKTLLAIALSFASIATAQAQGVEQNQNGGQFRFLAGAGYTYGGDTLATASYVKGGDINIKAGSGVVFTGGGEYRFNEAFSLQGTVNYHVDNASASNGDVRFQRYPIELIGYFHANQNWRVGGGVRYVSKAKLSSSGVASGLNAEFDDTVSGLVEVEYLVNRNWGVKLRYVQEKFENKRYYGKTDANHGGIFANYYF